MCDVAFQRISYYADAVRVAVSTRQDSAGEQMNLAGEVSRLAQGANAAYIFTRLAEFNGVPGPAIDAILSGDFSRLNPPWGPEPE